MNCIHIIHIIHIANTSITIYIEYQTHVGMVPYASRKVSWLALRHAFSTPVTSLSNFVKVQNPKLASRQNLQVPLHVAYSAEICHE